MINLSHQHTLSLRVYYEDTDFSGLVYHAAYFRFMERGRTEWLRDLGVRQQTLQQHGFSFVVVSVHTDFHRSARMDDALTVHTQMTQASPARMIFTQRIHRSNRPDETNGTDELLISAEVVVAAINRDIKPVRIVKALSALSATHAPDHP